MRSWRRLTTREWMAGAFCIALAILVLSRTLTSARGVDLRATARWSFVLFWLGTTGRSLATLFGPKFEELARRGRDLSLAYASAHLVHLAIVVRVLFKEPLPEAEVVFFGTAVFWTYLLAGLSVIRWSRRINPTFLLVVRTVGVEYIALAFLVDFAKNPFDGGFLKALDYLPFLLPAIAAPLLRLAALIKRNVTRRRAALA